jgi:hypothetical protein
MEESEVAARNSQEHRKNKKTAMPGRSSKFVAKVIAKNVDDGRE